MWFQALRDTLAEKRIRRGLDRAYNGAAVETRDLESVRLVVFSDHHKGKRDGADDFQRAEAAYRAALGYYLAAEYTLCVLGDVEELWECKAKDVIAAYRSTLELEKQFYSLDSGKNRYVRIFGNHDDQWEKRKSFDKHLGRFFPALPVHEGLRLMVRLGDEYIGEIFLVHGHQGSLGSDRFRFIAKPVVRYLWRPIQRRTGWRLNTPARSFSSRAKRDKAMHGWATEKKLLLIAGHTHKPVFLANPRSKMRAEELDELKRNKAPQDTIAEKHAELEWTRTLEEGSVRWPPCYFNTGCSSFDDGDCTGLEIVGQKIHLVRWPNDAGQPRRRPLCDADLPGVFKDCGCARVPIRGGGG